MSRIPSGTGYGSAGAAVGVTPAPESSGGVAVS